MDSLEAFTASLAQSHEIDASARKLAAEASRTLQDSEKLASSAVIMRQDAVDQFASDLQNADPLYRAALQIVWQDFPSPGPDERIQNHQLEQLQNAAVVAKDLQRIEEHTKSLTDGMPFASVTYQQLEYISNPGSLSNPHERDLKRTKVTGLTALVGVLGGQPITIGTTFERMGDSVNGIIRPLHIGLQYEAAVRIHSETGGWEYDVWEADPRVQNNQSGMVTILGKKQRVPQVSIISLDQGNENIYMALPKGNELHIGRTALADFAMGLELYEKPHDTTAFMLVRQIIIQQK